ncbi:MAG: ATP-binding protein [Planctomycetota bacterium]
MRNDELTLQVAAGESDTLEFKCSAAELRRAGETLCAFLSGNSGRVLIGVAPDGQIVGQDVADSPLRDLAATLSRSEPAAQIEVSRVPLANGRKVIVEAPAARDSAPFFLKGRDFQHVGPTTTTLPQTEYERLLLDRNHSRHRWENQPAVGVGLADLDHEEILRTRETAVAQRRLSAGTPLDVGDILDRLGLRIGGQVRQAAQMLYGTPFQPHYPHGLLKHRHAFAMVLEAIAWLDGTLPLATHFPEGSVFREDRMPVPAVALRQTIVNAVIHRDLSRPAGYVAVAVFDDRVEVHIVGSFPTGIMAAMLSQPHPSMLRNPLIAGAFHRTGAVEVSCRGTNRVIEACRAHGIPAPEYLELGGVVTVTFRVPVVGVAPRKHPGSAPEVSPEVAWIVGALAEEQSRKDLQATMGLKDSEHFRKAYLLPALSSGLVEMTLPDKPRCSKQRYRLTASGRRWLEARAGADREGRP